MWKRIGKVSFVLVLLAVVLTGCFRIPSSGSGGPGHTIIGMVVEEGTGDADSVGMPLANVEVTWGSQTVTTVSNGLFQFDGVPEGSQDFHFSLDGYESKTVNVAVTSSQFLNVELRPLGGNFGLGGETGDDFDDLDGTSTDDTTVDVGGNVNDFEFFNPMMSPPGVSSLSSGDVFSPQTTGITIEQLQAIINGKIYKIVPDSQGRFNETLPIDPGTNMIQLRVFDSEGLAHTSEVVRVYVTLERLDMRVTLTWDTATDVDVHMFKRNPDERNPIGNRGSGIPWNSSDRERYVGYPEKTPRDFGTGTAQNPVLDIDDTRGYGPETIFLQEITPGYYHVWVHFYGGTVSEANPTTATVQITLNEPDRESPLTRTFTHQLTEGKEYWYVTTVAWPSGEFIDVPPSAPPSD